MIKIQIRRGKQVLTLLTEQNTTVEALKKEIQEMINSCGGLKSLDDEDDEEYDDEGLDEDADIEIPKPNFADSDSDSDSDNEVKEVKKEKGKDFEGSLVTGSRPEISSIDQIKLGKPVNQRNPTGTDFTPIETKKVQLNEGDVLAFALVEEDFLVIDPVLED